MAQRFDFQKPICILQIVTMLYPAMSSIAFIDIEVNPETAKITDIGGVRSDEARFHQNSLHAFADFIKGSSFIAGHNIIQHDLKYLQKAGLTHIDRNQAIDTLYFSPLLFPQKPYHPLLKDDKIQSDEKNNPFNDSLKARELFQDEVKAFKALKQESQIVFYNLLHNIPGFSAFFRYIEFNIVADPNELQALIREELKEKICAHSNLARFISEDPVALAYAYALIQSNDRYSITPPWVLRNHPAVERLLFLLRNNPCLPRCNYCQTAFNPFLILKSQFGFDGFRSYDGEALQEKAVNAAIQNKSLLAIFPTGGGKSITFQVPALMSGRNAKALTVVISPLQSLMKDQVDNLEKKGITDAVTINGLLDPIERSKAIERVEDGTAFILYISPESLRSVTIERLLLKRKIARFVIDEAHCFSAWGQDFRVDYLYIGDFIKELQQKKELKTPIPISCFTATAKPKVIEDIKAYFDVKLGIGLETFRATVARANLHYKVYQKDNEEDKYSQLRYIVESSDCSAIVYVSRTKKAYILAQRLTNDGFSAKPYHGKMEKEEKTANQDAFMAGDVRIMVATSAFGMGVDKSDVGAVIHYDISDSLENYIQEAGRAGRDENIQADCYVLFNEEDLDKHFVLLNQTKLGVKEINQVWKAIKSLTYTRERISNSALEIARKAGWDDSIKEVETRVLTAIAALEDAGYVQRGQNMPRVFADSILTKTAQEAIDRIEASTKIETEWKTDAIRIIRKLISSKSKRLAMDELAESRVDYIADQLGMEKEKVIRIVELLREENILAQTKDLTAFIKRGENSNRSLSIAEGFSKLENFILSKLKEEAAVYHIKEINEQAMEAGIQDSSVARLKTILNFWAIKNWINRTYPGGSNNHVQIGLSQSKSGFAEKLEKRHLLARQIVQYLFEKSLEIESDEKQDDILMEFSVLELKEMAEAGQGLYKFEVSIDDVEDTLFYLSRIEAIKIEGGFMVVHNKLSISRLEKNNRIQYKESDYEKLGQYYRQKVQQIHIVGEYAKKMIRDYNEALKFVDDYFTLNYPSFLKRYFPGSREEEINRTLTPEKFTRLFASLSPSQLSIIKEKENQCLVVAAGPGSGKTRVLVHKLASLLMTEDVKHEQLLMLTFSRAAATEFKKRLMELIGNAAGYVEIKTFHSYCFDLMGRVGALSQADDIIKRAVEKIKNREIEISRITKTALVVDEAQDMTADEFELVKTLMEVNDDLRVILVGDDDQNIYGFRGADSKYMHQLITEKNAARYELIENFRSKANIVDLANQWVAGIRERLKSQPGDSNDKANGTISAVQYAGNNLIVPVCSTLLQADLTGTTCVLTKTNEEAALLTGMLKQNGLSAKLIQTNDGFPLHNLYELRYFSNLVLADDSSPDINLDDWKEAGRKLVLHARQSDKLELALAAIRAFESVNPKRIYKSDWKAFLFESKLEDFIRIGTDTVYISTIHKAKGKEFDNVYILSNQLRPDRDELKRLLYVAITRAKNNLEVHYNESFLRGLKVSGMSYRQDSEVYPEPAHLVISLTHRDVNLGYFEYVQPKMVGLLSGSPLSILSDGLGNAHAQQLLKFSGGFKATLEGYKAKGYQLTSAIVNFMVYWKKQGGDREVMIVLPQIGLVKAKA